MKFKNIKKSHDKHVEHACCYDTAIICEIDDLSRAFYGTNIYRICECNDVDADFIINALNSYQEKEENNELTIIKTKIS